MINSQKKPDMSREDAYNLLSMVYPPVKSNILSDHLDYWAYPEIFSSTAGPFKGRIRGQAFTTFTMEAWAGGGYAVIFCNGEVVKVTDEWCDPLMAIGGG